GGEEDGDDRAGAAEVAAAGHEADEGLEEVGEEEGEQDGDGDDAETVPQIDHADDRGDDEQVADGLDLPEVEGPPLGFGARRGRRWRGVLPLGHGPEVKGCSRDVPAGGRQSARGGWA